MHFHWFSPGYCLYVILMERALGNWGWDLDRSHLAWGSGGRLGALLVRAVPPYLLGLASERPSSITQKVLG